jgi:hypothetical protein
MHQGDEKHFRLEESLALTPKYLTTQCVNLYMKIFTSADPIPGLSDTNGIDPQVANRFSMLDLQGDIKTRPLFLSDKGRYVDSLTSFFAAELNARVASYQAKGFDAARRDADHVLAAFTAAHGLAKTAGLITDAYDEIRDDWVAFVHSRVADGHPDFLTFESSNGLFSAHLRVESVPRVVRGQKRTTAPCSSAARPRPDHWGGKG